jgi:hypothetical protein
LHRNHRKRIWNTGRLWLGLCEEEKMKAVLALSCFFVLCAVLACDGLQERTELRTPLHPLTLAQHGWAVNKKRAVPESAVTFFLELQYA